MTPHKELKPHLTPKERHTLELAIQGMSVEKIASNLQQSPKVVERYIHRGLQKLESWSYDAAPGPSFRSSQERQWGILPPRAAERRIARILREEPHDWGCVVVLGISEPRHRVNTQAVENVTRHIHRSTRVTDIVTKWSMAEWVIFLAHVSEMQSEMIVHRLEQSDALGFPVFVAVQHAPASASFHEVAMKCHQDLLRRYVNYDMASMMQSAP
ncbi:MAG: hypothetical protein C7B45_16600 [Sulfobacillus acidophilus]|uniref:HTH luxR-type domain-containing protein n=1 Tax=Sulfobacillus acidophilus TaxID=53633 RepID=A0A2T2WCZ3_9FIRM|nr:MAG: hypothetical protein C7B45_16600 [Sulfobacillus acidophilus]